MNDRIAVITGDIVGSRATPAKEWLPVLKQELDSWGSSPVDWEIYRGDSFQAKMVPHKGFIAIIRLKAAIKAFTKVDIRVSLGLGQIEYHGQSIVESNGNAFIRSGEGFEGQRSNFRIRCGQKSLDRELNLYVDLASLVMDYWKPGQAKVVKATLDNLEATQQEVASQLGITQGTVSVSLQKAGLSEILRINDRFQEIVETL